MSTIVPNREYWLPEEDFGRLKFLDFSGKCLGDLKAIKLADDLQKYTKLETLYLDDNKIGNKGAIALAVALRN